MRTVALVALAAAGACNTSYGTEGPTGDEHDAGEGGLLSDASGDVANDADAAPLDAGGDATCSWFCDDFEGEPWPDAGWTGPELSQGGTIARTTAESVSPDHALVATLPVDAGATPIARYDEELDRARRGRRHVHEAPALAAGTWLRVGFDYELGKPTRLTYGGTVVNVTTASPAADAGPETLATVTLRIGAVRNAASGSDSWSVAFDDVACDVVR